MAQRNPMVCIFVLNWNGRETTAKCLNMLQSITYPNYSVHLFDNGSRNGSWESLCTDFPEVNVIHLPHNIGFTGASNYAFSYLLKFNPEYICFVSNDVEVDKGFLEHLVGVSEADPSVGVVNPRIYYAGTDAIIWYAGGYFSPLQGKGVHRNFRKRWSSAMDHEGAENTTLTGCVYLVRTTVIPRVGGFDDDFFNYAEDTDWAIRMRKAGYSCRYEPRSIVWHNESHDIRQNQGNAYQLYYITRNILLLMKKHGTLLQWMLFLPYFVARRVVAPMIYYSLQGKYTQTRAIAHGIRDYLRGRFGKHYASW